MATTPKRSFLLRVMAAVVCVIAICLAGAMTIIGFVPSEPGIPSDVFMPRDATHPVHVGQMDTHQDSSP